MPLRLQARLAQLLQSGRFIRPGTSEIIEVDVRMVAASSVSFDQAISERRLVPELSTLLAAYVVQVPPLRERKEELSSLSRHFMHQLSRRYGLAPRNISGTTEKVWQAYEWPGNLDELEHAVKRYLIAGEMDPGMTGTPPDSKSEAVQFVLSEPLKLSQVPLPPHLPMTSSAAGKSLRSILKSVREETEKSAIAHALEKTGWNRKAAARLLKVSYRWILYKIDEYQLSTPGRSALSTTTRFGPGKADVPDSDHQRALNLALPRVSGGRA
jgi:DNA-binding NtrC family response regulator